MLWSLSFSVTPFLSLNSENSVLFLLIFNLFFFKISLQRSSLPFTFTIRKSKNYKSPEKKNIIYIFKHIIIYIYTYTDIYNGDRRPYGEHSSRRDQVLSIHRDDFEKTVRSRCLMDIVVIRSFVGATSAALSKKYGLEKSDVASSSSSNHPIVWKYDIVGKTRTDVSRVLGCFYFPIFFSSVLDFNETLYNATRVPRLARFVYIRVAVL